MFCFAGAQIAIRIPCLSSVILITKTFFVLFRPKYVYAGKLIVISFHSRGKSRQIVRHHLTHFSGLGEKGVSKNLGTNGMEEFEPFSSLLPILLSALSSTPDLVCSLIVKLFIFVSFD